MIIKIKREIANCKCVNINLNERLLSLILGSQSRRMRPSVVGVFGWGSVLFSSVLYFCLYFVSASVRVISEKMFQRKHLISELFHRAGYDH